MATTSPCKIGCDAQDMELYDSEIASPPTAPDTKSPEEETGRWLPWFTVVNSSLAVGLWFLGASLDVGSGKPWAQRWAGLDSLFLSSLVDNEDHRTWITILAGYFERECEYEDQRFQLWRWITYQWTHLGITHLLTNCGYNLFLGIAIEATLGTRRTAVLFNAGVLGGALCCLVLTPDRAVTGMDAGGFALLGAAFANILLKGEFMFTFMDKVRRTVRWFSVLSIVLVFFYSVFAAINVVMTGKDSSRPGSEACHLGGLLAGVSLGLIFGKNHAGTAAMAMNMLALVFIVVASVGAMVWMATVPIETQAQACWTSQVWNETLLSRSDYVCIRCFRRDCVDWWVSTQTFLEPINASHCNGDWVMSDIPAL